MKKILTLLTAFVLIAALLAGCGKPIENTQTPEPVQSGDTTEATVPTGNDPAVPTAPTIAPSGEEWNGYDIGFVSDNGIKYIWDQLGDDMKENVASVMNAIRSVELSCTLPHGIADDDNEKKEFINFIYNMCMDYTYIGTSFSTADRDGDGLVETVIIPYNFEVVSTQEEAWNLTEQLNQRLDEIVADMPQGTEYEQILYLHDALIFGTDYGENSRLPFTAYGALVEHQATCQGYADAMHLLLDRAGFETVFAVGHGTSDLVTHKWNYVHLSDGLWYAIDPTWADPEDKNDKYYVNYDYFLISDEVLLQDHLEKFESPYYSTPTAASMDLCYHMVEGYYVTSYEEAYECVKKQVIACAEQHKKYVYLRISDEDLYTEIHHKLLLTDYGGEIQDIIREAKEETGADDLLVRWSTYRAFKDGKGPLCIMVTLKYEGEETSSEDE